MGTNPGGLLAHLMQLRRKARAYGAGAVCNPPYLKNIPCAF